MHVLKRFFTDFLLKQLSLKVFRLRSYQMSEANERFEGKPNPHESPQ
jgi:hypothetical protein